MMLRSTGHPFLRRRFLSLTSGIKPSPSRIHHHNLSTKAVLRILLPIQNIITKSSAVGKSCRRFGSSSSSATTTTATTTATKTNGNQGLDTLDATEELEKEYTEALDQYKELQQLQLQHGDQVSHDDMNACLERLRTIYMKLYHWDQALHIEYTRLKYLDATNDNVMARHFHILGTILASEGKLVEATKHLKQAVALRNKVLGDSFSHVMGEDLAQLAKIYYARQDLVEASNYFRQAEVHYRHDGKTVQDIMQDTTPGTFSDMTSGHHADLTHILENQALVAKLMDNPRECALKFEAALQTIVDHADVDRKYLLKLGMAQAIDLQGAPDRALQMYQEMLQTFKDEPNISNPMLECILHGAIGESKYKEGKYGEAMTHLRTAYTTAKEQGGETHPEVGHLLNVMGACQAQLGNPSDAARHFREALFIARIKAKGNETDPEVQSLAANLSMVEQSINRPSWPGQSM